MAAATSSSTPPSETPGPAIKVTNLDFSYDRARPVLEDINFELPRGSRCLLVGDNGAGKTTLLKILAGRHMTAKEETVMVLGRSAARDGSLNHLRSYLGGDWGKTTVSFAGHGVPLVADIPVSGLMTSLQAEFPARRDKLYEILQINPKWRMNAVSDGQRRRVQCMLGLLRPFEVLLLDEITTDLDVVTRGDLLNYLREETITRGVTVVYTTHIFDGLSGWASHIIYLAAGKAKRNSAIAPLEAVQLAQEAASAPPTPPSGGAASKTALTTTPGSTWSQLANQSLLLRMVATWIREDRGANLAKVRAKELAAEKKILQPDGSAGGYAPGRSMQACEKNKSSRFYNYWS